MLEKVGFRDYDSSVDVEAYTDGYAYDEYSCLYLLSVSGRDSSVKAITSAVVSGRTVQILSEPPIEAWTNYGQKFRILSSRLPDSLRQASRRSWRIGQNKDVKVHYLYYRPTMQERAMQLMGSKLEASLAIEGKFSEEGLLAMTQGEDMTTAMAKALVEGMDAEGVESVWANLNKANKVEHRESMPEGVLSYLDPEILVKKKNAGQERQPASYGGKQLLLFGEV
jgi:hypothetical protein